LQVGGGPAWVVDVVVELEVVDVEVVGASVVVVDVVVVVVVVGAALLVQPAAMAARARSIITNPPGAKDFERRMSLLAIGTAPPSAIREAPYDATPSPSMTGRRPPLASIGRYIPKTDPFRGVVVPKPRQRRREGNRPHNAEHAPRDDGSPQARE
jgi:hypothetical protein